MYELTAPTQVTGLLVHTALAGTQTLVRMLQRTSIMMFAARHKQDQPSQCIIVLVEAYLVTET